MEAVLLTVTLLSLIIAASASVLAWRVMRNERRRSEARIAALTADLAVVEDHRTIRADRPQAPAVATDLPIHRETVAAPPIHDEAVAAPDGMFAPRERGRSVFRVAAAVCAAALIVAVVIGSLVMTSSRTPSASSGRPSEAAVAAAAATAPAHDPARADRARPRARSGSPDSSRRRTGLGAGRREGPADRGRAALQPRRRFHRERPLRSPAGRDRSGWRADVRGHRSLGRRRRTLSRKLQERRPHRAARRQKGAGWTTEIRSRTWVVSNLRVM